MKVVFSIILILFITTSCYADYVVFSHEGKILSQVEVGDRVVSKEKCAENNNLKEEEITVQYYKKDDVNEIEEETKIDTITDLKKQFKFLKGLQSQEERKEKQDEINNYLK